MHEHPNDCHFTPQDTVIGKYTSSAAPTLHKFSSNEKNAEVFRSCVQVASAAVDEARAALSTALLLTDTGLIDRETRAYIHAARLHHAAQKEYQQDAVPDAGREMRTALTETLNAWLAGFPAGGCSTPPPPPALTLSGEPRNDR